MEREPYGAGAKGNVFYKLSGLVTEASWQSWTEADLDPYLQIALTAFGPERVILGRIGR
jgi:L-fuconolactonase